MQELPQHEDKPVAREAGGSLGAGQALVPPADAHLGCRARLVAPRGEVGQGEEQGAQAHDQHAPAQPAGLVAVPPEVADEGQADAGRDVVGAGDQPALVTAQVEAALDGGDDGVDEAVDGHALQEGGHAEEEQDAFGCVAELQAARGEPPPATGQFLSISRHVFDPFLERRLLLGRAEGLGAGARGAGSPRGCDAIAQGGAAAIPPARCPQRPAGLAGMRARAGEVEGLSETKAIFSGGVLGHCHERECGVQWRTEVGWWPGWLCGAARTSLSTRCDFQHLLQ